MNKTLYYLACPYTDPDPFVVEARVLTVNAVVGKLFQKGIFVFSPISHMHSPAKVTNLSGNWETWAIYDELMVNRCDAVLVLKIKGHLKSKGVNAEIAIAKKLGKPIYYLDSKTLEFQ